MRTLIARDFAAAFDQVDVLVSPTARPPPSRSASKLDDPLAMYLADLATIPINLAGNAAMSLPAGLAPEDGLPVGLQIMAPAFADDRLYSVGGALEAALHDRWGTRCSTRPPTWRWRAMTDDRLLDDVDARRPTTTPSREFDPVLGLEVHVELGTATKMFCGCPTDVRRASRTRQTCPTCLGLPGALPVVNARGGRGPRSASGWRCTATIAPWCRFARKNYFYPDMPKDFQTSASTTSRSASTATSTSTVGDRRRSRTVRVEIERAHMEEDTGKSLHVGGATGRIHGADYSLVDYNRAGIPLVEIVTKPVTGTGALAPEVAQGLRHRAARPAALARRVRRTHGAGLAALRRQPLAAAVARVRRSAPATETKNVNSLRSVERAVRYEVRRHAAVLDAGRKIMQETRHFHEDTGATTSGREKPTPRTTATSRSPTSCRSPRRRSGSRSCARRCPSRRPVRRARLQAAWGITDQDMQSTSSTPAPSTSSRRRSRRRDPAAARKWWLGELARKANERRRRALDELPVTPADVARVDALVDAGTLDDTLARSGASRASWRGRGRPTRSSRRAASQVVSDDGALDEAVADAIAADPDAAQKVRDGKVAAVGALVGAVMKATRGQADAARVRELLLEALGQG